MIELWFTALFNALRPLILALLASLIAVLTPGCSGLFVTQGDTALQAASVGTGSADLAHETAPADSQRPSAKDSPPPLTGSRPLPSGPQTYLWPIRSIGYMATSATFGAAAGGAAGFAAGRRFSRSPGLTPQASGTRTYT